jgi:hypothetical protein
MAVSWRVTGQLDNQYDNGTTGQPVLGHIVQFVTGAGDTGSVFIPETRFNPTVVHNAITAKANLIDQVSKLHFDG